MLISIPKKELKPKHKKINISFQYLTDSKKDKIIILNFGSSTNIPKEIEVLKDLLINFSVDILISETTEQAIYWNLNNGKATSENYKQATAVNREKLLYIFNNSFS